MTPEARVRAFLAVMEARDLDAARAMLAPGFEMVFPGGVIMQKLEELIAWAAPRYQTVTKSFDAVESFEAEGRAIVYCRGTLAGRWPDGAAFSGIRFIDRFEIESGLIRRQEVWNDMGETRMGG